MGGKVLSGAGLLAVVLVASLSGGCAPSPPAENSRGDGAPTDAGGAAADTADTAANDRPTQETEDTSRTVYQLGFAAADTDTSVDDYLTSPGGIRQQCDRLNELLSSVCCPRFEIGCGVSYSCAGLATDNRDRMAGVADLYSYEFSGTSGYSLHHESVLAAVTRFLRTLQLYGRLEGKIPVSLTRHPLRIDDEETKVPSNKVDRRDPAFKLLGSVVPGVSARGGTRMLLDYYASRDGLLLGAAPVNRSSLAQAVAEFRANLFSFDDDQFTGRGARDLFDFSDAGPVPRLSGCQALAIKEPPYLRRFLRVPEE